MGLCLFFFSKIIKYTMFQASGHTYGMICFVFPGEIERLDNGKHERASAATDQGSTGANQENRRTKLIFALWSSKKQQQQCVMLWLYVSTYEKKESFDAFFASKSVSRVYHHICQDILWIELERKWSSVFYFVVSGPHCPLVKFLLRKLLRTLNIFWNTLF